MTWSPVHLTREGVSLVLTPSDMGEPVVQHWGRALGDLTADELASLARVRAPGVPHSALDDPRHTGLVPLSSSGFTGTPMLELGRAGLVAPVRLDGWACTVSGDTVECTASDATLGADVRVELDLTADGLLRSRTSLTNTGDDGLRVAAVRAVLPVPHQATELLDLTGRWIAERVPQRLPWRQGSWQRTSRHGRTGHDATLLLSVGTPGFGFRTGEVWAVHVAWSGDQTTYAERTAEGESLIGGAELLATGEVVLGGGETYESPWLVGAWSGVGLDGISARLHSYVRRTTPQPRRSAERKVLVNTWEAVYFDHDLTGLTGLAEVAAEVGVERFVLDDGWFHGRRDDRRGLGDWTVDREVWPEGLQPLIDRVQALGLDFGLWVEPEMVNVDSDLVRAHPDWVLAAHDALPPSWRHQQLLDLSVPAAYDHVRAALLALLDEYDIAYLKWDHNRDLIAAPGTRAQTLAFYRLLDELRAAHPTLEIESCASGGGRIDLGVLARTDRVWPSDTIDAVERQRINRWTMLIVPPEMTGNHLGGPTAHTTGRTHRLELRAATALLGHFGIEWDLRTLTTAERAQVRAWVELHKRLREVVATGRLVRSDHPDPAAVVTGVVSTDGSEGWYVVALTGLTATQHLAPVLLEGLDHGRRYRLTDETPTHGQHELDLATRDLAAVLPGDVLGRVGIRLGITAPETARVLHVRAHD
ncbi:alpha-galactosidase [Nocardioides sp.]|uniref:alpha-galactosidase n=1 Tax=Nocardioides sp. TaxID=35761 RepID=UPI002ED67E58